MAAVLVSGRRSPTGTKGGGTVDGDRPPWRFGEAELVAVGSMLRGRGVSLVGAPERGAA